MGKSVLVFPHIFPHFPTFPAPQKKVFPNPNSQLDWVWFLISSAQANIPTYPVEVVVKNIFFLNPFSQKIKSKTEPKLLISYFGPGWAMKKFWCLNRSEKIEIFLWGLKNLKGEGTIKLRNRASLSQIEKGNIEEFYKNWQLAKIRHKPPALLALVQPQRSISKMNS